MECEKVALDLGTSWIVSARLANTIPFKKYFFLTPLDKRHRDLEISKIDDINPVSLMMNLVFFFLVFSFQSYLDRKPTEPRQALPAHRTELSVPSLLYKSPSASG